MKKKSIIQRSNEAALAKWETKKAKQAQRRAYLERATPINREAKLLAYVLHKQGKTIL